ncbi:glutathione S-transferase N-terminal domain-containing protein [Muricoccus radiodurans]|uniref:glutathione S-transferase N-terminal domain-containing protein n=1 Tax=Muricoccus radiodurans TaxID=2231721 RepID=UPI003CEAACC5
MLLHWSPASPFARKVLASAIARRIESLIEVVETNPHASPADLLKANPLSKVPCLIAEDGTGIYDSRAICDYLDSFGEAPPLTPAANPARLRVQVMHALGDGIMDAAVARRMQSAMPEEEARTTFMNRQKAAVDRGLDRLEMDPPKGLDDVGAIAVASALGYLDFRFGSEPWRDTHPRLAAWFEEVSALPALKETAPAAPK